MLFSVEHNAERLRLLNDQRGKKRKKRKPTADLSGLTPKEKKEGERSVIQPLIEKHVEDLGLFPLRWPEELQREIIEKCSQEAKDFMSEYSGGQADIGAMKRGCNPVEVFFFEVKSPWCKKLPNGGLSSAQVKWWERLGVVPTIFYSVRECKEALSKFVEGTLK
jgi:hypothetical protein